MKKYTATLCRFVVKKKFTLGLLKIFNASGKLLFQCYTLELPYVDNQHNISSIPAIEYCCQLYNSSKFGLVYKILNVPGREGILFHKGNTVADSHGCILLGNGYTLNSDLSDCFLRNSKIALDKLMSLNITSFNLKISNLCL